MYVERRVPAEFWIFWIRGVDPESGEGEGSAPDSLWREGLRLPVSE